MTKTITQTIRFTARATQLYKLYMDSALHSQVTESSAKIGQSVGEKFSAYDGYAFGKNLFLVKNKQIVQTWRASDWSKGVPDSIFMLTFLEDGDETTVEMVHAFLPESEATRIKKGWSDYYWKPWKNFLKEN